MKKLLVILATLSLSGCALIDAYFMAKYDTNEYGLINKIRTVSEVSVNDCQSRDKSISNMNTLYSLSVEWRNFTQYIPRNENANGLANDMVKLTDQAKSIYAGGEVSETFCKLKLQQINRAADVAQKAIGSKPR